MEETKTTNTIDNGFDFFGDDIGGIESGGTPKSG